MQTVKVTAYFTQQEKNSASLTLIFDWILNQDNSSQNFILANCNFIKYYMELLITLSPFFKHSSDQLCLNENKRFLPVGWDINTKIVFHKLNRCPTLLTQAGMKEPC